MAFHQARHCLPILCQRLKGRLLVDLHEMAVALDISGEDGRQLALNCLGHCGHHR